MTPLPFCPKYPYPQNLAQLTQCSFGFQVAFYHLWLRRPSAGIYDQQILIHPSDPLHVSQVHLLGDVDGVHQVQDPLHLRTHHLPPAPDLELANHRLQAGHHRDHHVPVHQDVQVELHGFSVHLQR